MSLQNIQKDSKCRDFFTFDKCNESMPFLWGEVEKRKWERKEKRNKNRVGVKDYQWCKLYTTRFLLLFWKFLKGMWQ